MNLVIKSNPVGRMLYRLVACVLMLGFTVNLSIGQQAAKPTPGQDSLTYFTVRSGSILRLEGKSNVNNFTCNCNERFQPASFSLQPASSGSILKILATYLNLKVKSLDCGNKVMNSDMYKALNANTFPVILIEPLQVTAKEGAMLKANNASKWTAMNVYTRITLNGHSNEYWIDVTAKRLAPTTYRFTGSKLMMMTDFKVKPPEAMFGMIKVENEILIFFDLTVDLH